MRTPQETPNRPVESGLNSSALPNHIKTRCSYAIQAVEVKESASFAVNVFVQPSHFPVSMHSVSGRN